DQVMREYMDCVGLSHEKVNLKPSDRLRRFTLNRLSIIDRCDSESFAPLYAAYRKLILTNPDHATIGDLADVAKPAGRYTTNYVADESFGLRLLSGRQIAQYKPIAMKIMSPTAWDNPDEYLLKKDMVLLTADGRAVEN